MTFIGSATCVAALVVVAGATLTQGRPVVARGDAQSVSAKHLLIVGTARAEAKILNDPVLRSLPWLIDNPVGTSSPEAIEFPIGVSYGEALQRLYVSLGQSGTLPAGTVAKPSLPTRAVIREGTPRRGVQIDLRAPWGWDPSTGKAVTPSLEVSGALPVDQVQKIFREAEATGLVPAQASVDVPVLPNCQVIEAGRADVIAPCPSESSEVTRG